MTDTETRARDYVLETHAEVVETVLQCADAVADEWDGDATTDRTEVTVPLRAELESTGAWQRFPEILAGAVGATDYSLSAPPVADPPYVVLSSRGPLLRATLADGRLVVRVAAFEIERASQRPRYVRGAQTPEEAVSVAFE